MLSALKRWNGIGHLLFPLVNTKEAQINRNKIAHNIQVKENSSLLSTGTFLKCIAVWSAVLSSSDTAGLVRVLFCNRQVINLDPIGNPQLVLGYPEEREGMLWNRLPGVGTWQRRTEVVTRKQREKTNQKITMPRGSGLLGGKKQNSMLAGGRMTSHLGENHKKEVS